MKDKVYKLLSNQAFRQKIIDNMDNGAVIELFATQNVTLTQKEAQDIVTLLTEQTNKLDMEDLGSIAGGYPWER
ncbi:hypothetical protein LJC49_04600 [Ruminococcaceae bacterium OttesenSCG-928-I18]|nr:hypothetical protein [Ruminococcaceae bacterium OttesenSCG-928-I18]